MTSGSQSTDNAGEFFADKYRIDGVIRPFVAHGDLRDIIHCNQKPRNVLLTRGGFAKLRFLAGIDGEESMSCILFDMLPGLGIFRRSAAS
jgi:hypothetical protein